jgi:hypothetical protein
MTDDEIPVLAPVVRTPPPFCQYADGACDQRFNSIRPANGIFLYPNDPPEIAATIERAVEELELSQEASNWLSWKRFAVAGQVIFCEICKRMRFADFVAADVTTLNFNLMFEIGFAIGLGLPVLPIRDTSFIRDQNDFKELALLDTVGYTDFRNTPELVDRVKAIGVPQAIPRPNALANPNSPIYLLKSKHETEGELVVTSILRRGYIDFRVYDANESPRLALYDALKQVSLSLGVVAHLLHEERAGARVHNARCAFVAGLAMAQGKVVALLQEGEATQPIDYRDVVKWYSRPEQIQRLLERPLQQIFDKRVERSIRPIGSPQGLLQQLDLGDVAAENEIRPLRSYFVQTAQYNEA